MSGQAQTTMVPHGSTEARRLAELARAAGLGDSPDSALNWGKEAMALIGLDRPTPLLADMLRWQGSVLRDKGRTSEAEPLYKQSIQVATDLKYDMGRAHGLNCLGSLAQRRGDLRAATDYYGQALALAERSGEARLVGMLQQNLGIIADIRGNPAAAFAHYSIALRTFEDSHDLQNVSWALSNLGYLHVKERRFSEARAVYERALAIAKDRGDLLTEGIIEENRGELELIVGKPEAARESIARALAIADQRGDGVHRAAALKLLGARQRMSGEYDVALDTLQQALTLSAVGEDAFLGAELLFHFASTVWARGDERTAREVFSAALDAFERIGARQWVARIHRRLTEGDSSRYF